VLPGELWKQTPPADAAQFDHQVLFQREHYRYRVEPRKFFTDIEKHLMVRVLSDHGRRFASQKVQWGTDAELVSCEGRTVSPDGKVTPLERSQVFFTHDADGNGHAQLAFQLPNAEVGSVLEYEYVVTAGKLLMENDSELRTDVPVEHYEVQFDVNTGLQYAFHLYDTESKTDEDDDIAYHVVKWHAEHLTPHPKEDYGWAPAPRWAFRLTDYQLGRAKQTLEHGWDDVFKHALTRVSLPEFSEGFTPQVDVRGCGASAKCRTREAWLQVHRLTDTTKMGDFTNARPLATVVASHFASRHEQVLLFRALAESAGLATDFVLVTNPYRRDFDREYPTTVHDDVLAWVRPAGDLPEGLFVDASCESCQPGVVRDTVNHADGVRASVVVHDELHVQSQGALTTVVGNEVADDELDFAGEMTVESDGDLVVKQQISARGDAAAQLREVLGTRRGSDQQDAEMTASHAYPQAVLTGSTPFRCDKEAGRCTRSVTYRVPRGAADVDGKWVVPLAALGPRGKLFEAKTREGPINITAAGMMRHSLTVKLPAGWKVVEGPKPYDGIGAGFNGKVIIGGGAGTWSLTTELIRKRGRWPVSSYAKAREVVQTLGSVSDESLVLAKE
jgi:hypothetical protein